MPRLNFDITDAQMKAFKALEKRTGASSMKELVNNAFTMLEWAVEETARGHEVAAVNEEDSVYRVFVTPLLQHVAREERMETVASKA